MLRECVNLNIEKFRKKLLFDRISAEMESIETSINK